MSDDKAEDIAKMQSFVDDVNAWYDTFRAAIRQGIDAGLMEDGIRAQMSADYDMEDKEIAHMFKAMYAEEMEGKA